MSTTPTSGLSHAASSSSPRHRGPQHAHFGYGGFDEPMDSFDSEPPKKKTCKLKKLAIGILGFGSLLVAGKLGGGAKVFFENGQFKKFLGNEGSLKAFGKNFEGNLIRKYNAAADRFFFTFYDGHQLRPLLGEGGSLDTIRYQLQEGCEYIQNKIKNCLPKRATNLHSPEPSPHHEPHWGTQHYDESFQQATQATIDADVQAEWATRTAHITRRT